uniref:ATP synthase epsilon chain, chloroplastic n=1 Tax=Chlorokybus atmophyticus TaxID=3144 RepID=Q19V66_CHLAT|nr:ATP synthase CF1 epsilon subunit [Chlorokybus atmophyticus]ABD62171.2 CF1 epsilon subunit of ATP synthase [Chlorokybus atmophyticus]WKT05656.1 CF1 epsilon subunit of ATP synthase [Chlorokybus atmophyticus]
MSFQVRIMAPNGIIWDSEAQEIILTTNTGQIGVLTNHTSLLTALDIGTMKIRTSDTKWSTLALMSGFAVIKDNQVTIIVSEAEDGADIDLEKAQNQLEEAKSYLEKAKGSKNEVEANLALKRAETRFRAASNL